ncbi:MULTISPECIES: NtaA/DmoA family FMN-dependent monooxygenase [unclassified Rothia (in: high G+C Gram-positive bacteria)]|uniref:NtaA/DmoA family FMN-dependent monooxygenase n=1 Tax=unclassified Rothia (in: high G+C Gram-positive bacteria) TaxID=2689056 RepID=UPI00195682EC|nr:MULTISPECIES: NtaA/DmoA family FMN-dependent monooxygenase [unclassified Rothia (in: high G+C Gram-positive bacteria)]MBM7050590.1 NtaA/DmoA family FMN-dependent monooxygenase [Rothia sp. ZJ1223]QRZ60785.1 NtaA/DmoA family FMN-dependent monooxygenase [Rothia sp. ZJ932]
MSEKKMLIGMQMGNGYGSQVTAWKFPGVDPLNYANLDAHVRYAQKAERGKFQFIFFPDSQNDTQASNAEAPQMTLDPLITIASMARETKNIGFATTASTSWNAPYNLARQLKTLDVISGGRIGWNAVTGSDPRAAANFGEQMQSSEDRYGRAHEFIQITQALWGSWDKDAWVADAEKGIFADKSKIRPINLSGKYLASAGPLPIPPSKQGQPVIFHAGGSPNSLTITGNYANVVIGATFTIEDSIRQRNAVRAAAERAGRNPDEVKFIAGVMPTVAATKREALDRRGRFVEPNIGQRVSYLGMMLGTALTLDDLDQPLSPEFLANARPNPGDPRSAKALEIARKGWSVRDILYHGVIDFHPSPVGTAEEVADHLTEWFEAGAADGFWFSPDAYEDGIDAFVDGVVPILQERGLFHADYEGETLREHVGAPEQYGLDARMVQQ